MLSRNNSMMSKKGHNSAINLWKMMCHNPKLNIVTIYAYTRFGQNPFKFVLKILSGKEILT